jgi:hypothetical protein
MGAAAVPLIIGAAAFQAYSMNEAAKDQRRISNKNAALLDAQAADTTALGEEEVLANKRRVRRAVGEQRAAYASQGVDVGTGTAIDMQNETKALGAIDEATIRRNAFRQAWGISQQAQIQRVTGQYARNAGRNQAIGTMLGGVGTASMYWNGSAPSVAGANNSSGARAASTNFGPSGQQAGGGYYGALNGR